MSDADDVENSMKRLMRNLDKIAEKVPKNMAIRVGVLGSDSVRQDPEAGVTNSEIGIEQEYGSITNNIPARSWLRMPIERNMNRIAAFMGSKKVLDMVFAGKAKAAFRLVGVYAEGWVQAAFATGGFGQWAPNSPVTIARKGSSKPLIDTSQLRRSVSSEVVNAG